ncbi:MAG TPA: C4-type zinc ribbon domain-containing protein [Actinomycetota bacterium]|nr:C4-type zinc ribbon domain-containing protein [Actinomycetota bacterium]
MAPEVDTTALHRLLDLQGEDSAIKRLVDQRGSLPEAARLEELKSQLAELDADLEIAGKQRDEIAREVARVEGEIELVDQKIQREEQRMYSGQVSNPKELSALQAEVEMLKKKKAGLEDQELEAMVGRDQADTTVQNLTTEHEQATKESGELTEKLGELTQSIDADLARHNANRTQIAGSIPDDMLILYEKIREQKHGIGAAALENGTCQGCHTALPAKEVERLRASGGLQRCENCRRILIVN